MGALREKVGISLCIILTIMSCKKLDELTQFRMEFTESVTLSATTQLNLPTDIFTPELETNSTSAFEIHDTKKELVEEIKLEELKLTVKLPDEADFSFLQSVEIFMYSDNIPETKIAWKENIPNDAGASIILNLNDVDLKEFIKSDKFGLRVSTICDEVLNPDHEIEVYTKFFVDAKILGQ